MNSLDHEFSVDDDRVKQILNTTKTLIAQNANDEVEATAMLDYLCVCIGKLLPEIIHDYGVEKNELLRWVNKVSREMCELEERKEVRENWRLDSHKFEVNVVPISNS